MALSFPPSPSTGQTYQQWQWDGAKWIANPGAVPGLVTSYNARTGAVTSQTGDETSGNRALITTQVVATAVATVDFLSGITSTYDLFELEGYGVLPVSNAVTGYLRFSTDGSTFDVAANYGGNQIFNTTAGTPGGAYAAAAQISLGLGSDGNVAQRFLDFKTRLWRLPFSGVEKVVLSQSSGYNSTNGEWVSYAKGWYNVSPYSPVVGVRFLFSTGNVAAGTFKLYGIKK